MRNFVLATGLMISSISAATAVELPKCNQNSVPQRIDCVEKNVALLNRSHEADVTELRNAIKDLTAKVQSLTTKVDSLQIPKLDQVVIQWFDHPNSCITYQGNNLVQVVDTCVDPNRNRFVVRPYRP